MKKYKYTALNIDKKKFTGIFLAENEDQLALKLAEQNLCLVKATPVKKTTASTFWSASGKVKVIEIASFCRQFAIMLNVGIPIIEALNILKGQSYSDLLKKTLAFIHEDVKSGMLLSEAMKKHNKVFPQFLLSMIFVGEVSGALDKIFVTLADYFETDSSIKKKTKSALIYPVILIILAIGIVVLMVTFIIPTFMETFSTMDVEMPAITMALNDFSIFVKDNWKPIVLGTLGLIIGMFLFVRTKTGAYYFDMFKAKAPLIGKINMALITARFARAFGILVDGGLDVVDAMETVEMVLGNKYVSKKFKSVTEEVRNGMSLTVALNIHKIFPSLIVQMISVGEGTGSLGEVLNRSCAFFDEQAETLLMSLTTMLQPMILGIIGGSVGVLFYAIYSPLLQVMNTFSIK